MLCFKDAVKSNVSQYFPSYTTMILDIETDGLSHKNRLVLIGVLITNPYNDVSHFIQWFNDDGKSELEILNAFIQCYQSSNVQKLITFNGNSFDLPFLNAKFNAYDMGAKIEKDLHIDLLKVARSNKSALNADQLTLKSIELVLGISRKDTISGKENVQLYLQYLRNKTPEIIDILCLHNKEDILHLAPLLQLFDRFPQELNPYVINPIRFKNNIWYLVSYNLTGNFLSLQLKTPNLLAGEEYFTERYGIHLHCINQSMLIKLQSCDFPKLSLTTLDTVALFGIAFDHLSNDMKQQYVVKYQSLWNTDGILMTIQQLIEQHLL